MEKQAKEGTGVPLALARVTARARRQLTVSSPTIRGGIPAKHSEYADGVSPEISWSRLADAKSYALILEDPDAKSIRPFVHWVAWNIPADTIGLAGGPAGTATPCGTRWTSPRDHQPRLGGIFGPRPPVGDPPHHYHFQVFALDTELDVPPGSERDQLLAAMEGHVLAVGELVGTFQQSVEPPK